MIKAFILPVIVAIALKFAAPAAFSAGAQIEGRVKLPDTRDTPVPNQRYEIVSKGGVISPNPPVAVVYLEGDFPAPGEQPVARMIQRGLAFEPRILPIRAGTRVEFPNEDETYHNVFSYSKPKRFDLGRYRADETPVPSQVFETPGLVTLRCDIHEHMRGVILVLDTPHFVITDTSGRFRLSDLPAGTYTLKAWIDSSTTLTREVQLAADARLEVDLE